MRRFVRGTAALLDCSPHIAGLHYPPGMGPALTDERALNLSNSREPSAFGQSISPVAYRTFRLAVMG